MLLVIEIESGRDFTVGINLRTVGRAAKRERPSEGPSERPKNLLHTAEPREEQ